MNIDNRVQTLLKWKGRCSLIIYKSSMNVSIKSYNNKEHVINTYMDMKKSGLTAAKIPKEGGY